MLAVTGVRMNIVLVSDKGQVKHEPEKCAPPPIIPPLFTASWPLAVRDIY